MPLLPFRYQNHYLAGKIKEFLKWIPITSEDPNLRPFCVSLLYARVLLTEAESREKLFRMIDELNTLSLIL